MFDIKTICIVRGRAAIGSYATALEKLSESCGQSGAMRWMEYFLRIPSPMQKRPCLLLGQDRESKIHWAVLLFEIFPYPLASKIFIAYDGFGFQTVIAPIGEREAAAVSATNKLMENGARAVILSWESISHPTSVHRLQVANKAAWAVREKSSRSTLRLHQTFEETLMHLGKSTRFNMRYYRRRLARTVEYSYEHDLRETLSLQDLDRLNRESLYPVPKRVLRLRHEQISNQPDAFMVGLRDATGRILSLVAGWRQGTRTVLDWQLNASGMEKASLGTVMRGHFIEQEIARGATELRIHGGTHNSIEHSLALETGTQFFVIRQSWMAFLQLVILAAMKIRIPNIPDWAKSIADKRLQWNSVYTLPSTSRASIADMP